ncbi:hypothetical protein [Microcoleus sp. Pol11C3]
MGNQVKIACETYQRLPVNSYVFEEAVRPAPLPSRRQDKNAGLGTCLRG